MEVVCCQIDIAWEDKGENFGGVGRMVEEVRVAEGAVVVLPEMFATGFSMAVERVADEDGETVRFLGELAKRWGVYVVGGVVTRQADGRGRNEAAVIAPDGRELARYQKMYPFTYGGEDQHYAAGERPVVMGVRRFGLCPFICYDLRFPEAFRAATKQGANLFVVIANWPASRHEHWTTLLAARAIEDQAYVTGVNRCGSDPKLTYAGGSRIVDPRGRVLAEAGDGPQVIRARVAVEELEEYRRTFPVLGDIR